MLQEIVSHKPYPQPDLYHRYDFVKDLKVGSIIVDKPIAFLSNTSFPATLSRSKWVNLFISTHYFNPLAPKSAKNQNIRKIPNLIL